MGSFSVEACGFKRKIDDQRGHLMGFLYVDGHVRAYHGQRAIASKAYVARRERPHAVGAHVAEGHGRPGLARPDEMLRGGRNVKRDAGLAQIAAPR
jgi:prepilin-type processing-associated H-X9-DG protein